MILFLWYIKNAPYNAPKKKSDPLKTLFSLKNSLLQNSFVMVAVVIA